MKLKNTPRPEGGIYEKPKPGRYLGILIGVAYIGHHTGQYGSKAKVLLRWELKKRTSPSLDSQGNPHTITAPFGLTISGPLSKLKQCMEAHIGRIGDNDETDTNEWIGKAAWLVLEESDKGFINVVNYQRLDEEDDKELDLKPKLTCEHWDDEAKDKKIPPPHWATFWLGRSDDLKHLGTHPEARAPGSVGAIADTDEDIPF